MLRCIRSYSLLDRYIYEYDDDYDVKTAAQGDGEDGYEDDNKMFTASDHKKR